MNENATDKCYRLRLAAIGTSVAVSILLMGIKFYAWHLTRSSAILSDALESIINVVASGFAMASIIIAAKPPDEDHPFGHGKIEFFSAGFEGGLILVAAFGIFYTGVRRLLSPAGMPHLDQGLLLLLAAGIVNMALGVWLVRIGRKSRSLVLVADGKHVLTDVYTSGGVLLGLMLVRVSDWYWMDGAIACIVGVNIVYTGAKLVREAIGGLMDRADPQLLDGVVELLERQRKECWIDVHQLRVWRSGSRIHTDMHLILPRDLSLEAAHSEAKTLEKLVTDHFRGDVDVLIHMDPCIEDDCPVCSEDPCDLRSNDGPGEKEWTRETVTAMGWGGDRLNRL